MNREDALIQANLVALRNGHEMLNYKSNGKNLLLCECGKCGGRAVATKKGRTWVIFGTTQDYKCESEDE